MWDKERARERIKEIRPGMNVVQVRSTLEKRLRFVLPLGSEHNVQL